MKTVIPFEGFYESIHDDAFNDAIEHLVSDDTGEQIPGVADMAQSKVDWTKARNDYSKLFTENFADLFGLKTLVFQDVDSPREYNFHTDRIFCDIELSDVEMMFNAVDKKDLADRIKKVFTARSGFIPAYDSNLNEWESDLSDWDHNQVGTLLEVYVKHHDNYSREYSLDLVSSEACQNLLSDYVTDEIRSVVEIEEIENAVECDRDEAIKIRNTMLESVNFKSALNGSETDWEIIQNIAKALDIIELEAGEEKVHIAYPPDPRQLKLF